MRYGKVGLQLGHHQKYYISRCEEKQSIQLTITVVGDDAKSVQERRELVHDVTQLLNEIMKVFMPEMKLFMPENKNILVTCPLCSTPHITLNDVATSVATGVTFFCTKSDGDKCMPLNNYHDLIPGEVVITTHHRILYYT